ncbi:MAG: hypothetical protein DRP09_15850 [Candidatus Thorarchaeota archaeon]|nr:MAG: hypothetical protein DRP09_15850 [Candidatus Thorarchaeota archaeon]
MGIEQELYDKIKELHEHIKEHDEVCKKGFALASKFKQTIEEQKAQVDKMKNCGNCNHFHDCGEYIYGCKKWTLI